MRDKERRKEYMREYSKRWYQGRKDLSKEYRKRYHQEHKERENEYSRRYILKYRYNLTLEQIDEILIEQDHKCAICRKSLDETKRCIDHDHVTRQIRGILCHWCNSMLGYAYENPKILERGIEYLQEYNMNGGI